MKYGVHAIGMYWRRGTFTFVASPPSDSVTSSSPWIGTRGFAGPSPYHTSSSSSAPATTSRTARAWRRDKLSGSFINGGSCPSSTSPRKPYTSPSYGDVCPIPLRKRDNLDTVMTVGVPPSGVVTVRKDSSPSDARTSSANSLSMASTRSWVRRGSTTLAYLAFMAANTARAASRPRLAVFATNHSVRVPGSAA